MKIKIIYLTIILLIVTPILICAQQTIDGFIISETNLDNNKKDEWFTDVNASKLKSPLDSNNRPLNIISEIRFTSREKLNNIEREIFTIEERKHLSQYKCYMRVLIHSKTKKIEAVSFAFRLDKNDTLQIDYKKLAQYRETVKEQIKFDFLSFERPVNKDGYITQILPIFKSSDK
jgi:hypothetical protein